MLKQRKEKVMLNKKINFRLLIILVSVLLLSACSVTQQVSSTDSSSKTEYSQSYNDALSAMESKKYNRAQTLLREVINKQPNFSNAHVNLGITFLKNNSLNEAENSFQHALRINPENKYALNQLGILYRQQGDFSASKSFYEKAINIDSDYAFAILNLGILYDLYLYDFSRAIEQYKTYQKLIKKEDSQVKKWIIDLERRYKKSLAKK